MSTTTHRGYVTPTLGQNPFYQTMETFFTTLDLDVAVAIQKLHGPRGLVGQNNATTPNTKYDLSFKLCAINDPFTTGGGVFGQFSGTVDIALAGPVANGRDKAAAFASPSWLYVWFIYGREAPFNAGALIVTESQWHTSPTLPTGYTECAFLTALRRDGSGNLLRSRVVASKVFYESDDGTNQVLNAGNQTSFTLVNVGGLVPPICRSAVVNAALSYTHTPGATSFGIQYRPTGSALTSGILICRSHSVITNGQGNAQDTLEIMLNSSQQFDYKLTNAPTTGGAFIDVVGYSVPNGDT